MEYQLKISPFDQESRQALISLLRSEKLPVEDLPQDLSDFFMASDNGLIVGAVGLEIYDRSGLLRSLVVKPEYRKLKIGASLVKELEKHAKSKGLADIYLLTETAGNFFSHLGFEITQRNEAPASIQGSSEFSHVCPVSATLMKKKVAVG